MPAEQTTRLNKNPNLNKLQAGYLFPEVSFRLAGQLHLNVHTVAAHIKLAMLVVPRHVRMSRTGSNIANEPLADRKAEAVARGEAPQCKDYQPGDRRHHRAHPQLCCGCHGGSRQRPRHTGGLLWVSILQSVTLSKSSL